MEWLTDVVYVKMQVDIRFLMNNFTEDILSLKINNMWSF